MWLAMFKNPITTGLLITLLIAGAIISAQHLKIANLRAEVAEQKTAIEQLTAANQAFKEAVDRQNEAVEKLKLEGERRARAAAKALAEARAAAENHQARAAAIQRLPVTGDECQAADKLITQYVSGAIH